MVNAMRTEVKKDYSKYLLITAVALFIAAYFPAKLTINPEMGVVSGVFIIILAMPCYIALVRWIGLKKSLIILIVLSIYAISIETFAIVTGFPYSSFHYTEMIGYKIFGYTPYTVPFAYVPLFLGCFYLSMMRTNDTKKMVIITTLLVLATDFVLDPAAVALKFWVYTSNGIFYGVPLMNFLGWILSGFLASLITLYFLKDHIQDVTKPSAVLSSLFLILVFWSGVCLYLGLLLPFLMGIIILIYILFETRFKIGCF
jgi:putative membrane protein